MKGTQQKKAKAKAKAEAKAAKEEVMEEEEAKAEAEAAEEEVMEEEDADKKTKVSLCVILCTSLFSILANIIPSLATSYRLPRKL